jgi:hypothetical protein
MLIRTNTRESRPTGVLRSREREGQGNAEKPPPGRLVATEIPKGDLMPEGYCVKERKKVEIKDPVQITMKNGRPAIQGTCPDCGTKIFKIGKM